jgi:hypothetical protein
MADRLVELVLDGTKTATSSLAWEYDGPAPAVGDLAIVVDGDGRPWCIIETTEVYALAFDEVDEAMAHEEGEGDRSLAGDGSTGRFSGGSASASTASHRARCPSVSSASKLSTDPDSGGRFDKAATPQLTGALPDRSRTRNPYLNPYAK